MVAWFPSFVAIASSFFVNFFCASLAFSPAFLSLSIASVWASMALFLFPFLFGCVGLLGSRGCFVKLCFGLLGSRRCFMKLLCLSLRCILRHSLYCSYLSPFPCLLNF